MADLALDSADQSVSVAMVRDTLVDMDPAITAAVLEAAMDMAAALAAAMDMAVDLAVVITAAFDDTRIFINQSHSSQADSFREHLVLSQSIQTLVN